MLNLEEYTEKYNTANFKEIVKKRLEENFGDTPNIQKDEGYESILISVYYELEDKKYFLKTIEELIYEYYEEKNIKALNNIQKLYIKFYQEIKIKDIFSESFDFNQSLTLEQDLTTLRFLNIAKLRKEDFWHNCYFKILNNFQDTKTHIDLLLTIINGINSFSILNTADMWNKLYVSLANINTNTTTLLVKIIINQWILATKDNLDKNQFIQTLSSIEKCDFMPLKISKNKEFNTYLNYAINFLLKHKLEKKEENILKIFSENLNNLAYSKKEDVDSIIFKIISSQPKYLSNLILEQSQDSALIPYKRNLMISKTPAMIMAMA